MSEIPKPDIPATVVALWMIEKTEARNGTVYQSYWDHQLGAAAASDKQEFAGSGPASPHQRRCVSHCSHRILPSRPLEPVAPQGVYPHPLRPGRMGWRTGPEEVEQMVQVALRDQMVDHRLRSPEE